MAIPEAVVELFNNFMEAIEHDAVTLIECTDKVTGDPAYVMAVTIEKEDEGTFESYPVGILYEDQKALMDLVNPPEGVETFDNNKEEEPEHD